MDEALLMLICVLCPFLLALPPVLFMIYRNHVVYGYRVQFLDDYYEQVNRCDYAERMRRYHSLPTYDSMMMQLRTFNWDYRWKEVE